MIQIAFPGGSMPALGLGTWQLRGDAATAAVTHALALGYRHVDTAQIYKNEAAVGAGLKTAGVERDAVFLTTKVWRDQLKARDVIASTEDSLRRLGTDYVDLLLVHWPNDDVELAETLDAFQEVQHREYARHIGVSNFPPALVRQALQMAPGLVCNQVEYHPYLSQENLLGVLRDHGMILTAYSPLARGEVFDEAVVREIAEAHGKTPAQVVLRWEVQQDGVAAIPKAASARHRESNFDIFDFTLTADEMARLHGLAHDDGRMIDPDFAPDWDAA